MTEHLLEGKSLEWLLESATDAMVITDQEDRIILVNPPVEHLFGYPRQELIGKPMDILIPGHAGKTHHCHLTDYFAQPYTSSMGEEMELLARRQYGSEIPLYASLSPHKNQASTVCQRKYL